WCRAFEDSDACLASVLTFREAAAHPHAVARGAHITMDGVTQPAPAPRFSRTPGAVRGGPPERGAGGRQALEDWGFANEEVERLAALGLGFTSCRPSRLVRVYPSSRSPGIRGRTGANGRPLGSRMPESLR